MVTDFCHACVENCRELCPQAYIDVGPAGVADRIQPYLALFAAQRVEFLYCSRLAKIVPEDGDIDVLGKARDQAIRPIGSRVDADRLPGYRRPRCR
jgi:hypothetical protein